MAATQVTNLPASVRAFYSKEILRASRPKFRFAQFAKKKTDLKANAGNSIKFTKYSSLTKGSKLTEGTPLSEKALSNSEVTITVDEYGNATAVSEKALSLSMHDELSEASIALANDMALVLDEAIRDVALSTTNILYGGGKASAAALASGDGLDTKTIKNAVELLETNNSPKVDGQYYICIAHPHQLRQLRDDSNWISCHHYSNVDNVYKGEVGMYEGVRFVDSTQMPARNSAESNTKFGTTGISTWQAVLFGENAFGWAEALEVEMRDNGTNDYGRVHGIAWYAIWGFGLIEEKNIVSIVTA